jgi:rhodanese-related sulfurtransferase
METISRQELKAKLDANQAIKLVMTVGGWTFRAKHIPGSLSFPSPRCALQALRCDDQIILYSTSNGRQDTRAAFDALSAHGYRNVRCYEGGLADWESAGYPVEGSVDPPAGRRQNRGRSLVVQRVQDTRDLGRFTGGRPVWLSRTLIPRSATLSGWSSTAW